MLSRDILSEILDFAITGEEAAYRFYTEWAGKMKNDAMRRVFLDFAQEELRHKSRLEEMKKRGTESTDKVKRDDIENLKMADYLVNVTPKENMDYQEALILAMKRETAAFKLYSDLAEAIGDPQKRELFFLLAREEASHKLKFEIEYDDEILKEN